MKNIVLLILIFQSMYADITLIGTPSCGIYELKKSDIDQLYMGKKTEVHGNKTVVFDSSDNDLYNDFVQEILKKSTSQMKVYWTRMVFTGTRKPIEKIDRNMIAKLGSRQGYCYVTYVRTNNIPPLWNKIEKINE